MRRVLVPAAIAAAFVAGLLGYAALGAPPTVTLESQGWWSTPGIIVPTQVGQHVHVKATVPADGYVIDGLIDVPVTVTLHDQTGAAVTLRVSDGSTIKQSWTINLGPCADCSWSGIVSVDFSTWGTGRREMRWTANIPKNDEGNRQYQSTGWQVCVRSCTPTYRTGPWTEARGWYTDHGYQNARLTSPLADVRAGGTVKVKLAPGSGGKATTFSGAYIDPDFHHGSEGTVLLTRNGSYSGSVTIPADLPAGPHRLVLLASDGLNAGILLVPFTVGSTPTPTPSPSPTPTIAPTPTPTC